MRTLRLWAALLAVVAGCGGGGGSDATPTTARPAAFEAFARDLSLICRGPSDLISTLDAPSTPTGLAANARQVARATKDSVSELRSLRPPARQGEVEAFIDGFESFGEAFADLAAIASEGDDDGIDGAVDRVARRQAEVREHSIGLGVDCGLVDPDDPGGGARAPTPSGPAGDPAATIDGYGANARLDELADQCFAGDLESCDALFRGSPGGSGHEDYASTCGGRFGVRVDGACAAVGGEPIAPADDIEAFGSGGELDALATACFEGVLVSCNELFFAAPVDSGYEGYAATCGRRTERELVGFCPAVVAAAVD